MAKLRNFFAASLIVSSLAACTSSPTGRSQLVMFSKQEMSQLGARSFEEMKKKETISQNTSVNQYVQCVTDQITQYVPPQTGFKEWEVVVFESDQINAFALPGGKIGVYTGLLKIAKDQDQLATVIGHEIAHVLADHGNERMSQAQIANAGMQITAVALGSSEYAQYRDLTMAALGIGVQVGVLLPYGREQESEADILGLELMAKAGFTPKASVSLWQNMGAASKGKQPPEILSTHPSNATRIDGLREKIRQMPNYNSAAPDCKRPEVI